MEKGWTERAKEGNQWLLNHAEEILDFLKKENKRRPGGLFYNGFQESPPDPYHFRLYDGP